MSATALTPADFVNPHGSFDVAAVLRAAHARARHGRNIGICVLAGIVTPSGLQMGATAIAFYASAAATVDVAKLPKSKALSYASEFKAALERTWADARGAKANAEAAARWQASRRPAPMFAQAAE